MKFVLNSKRSIYLFIGVFFIFPINARILSPQNINEWQFLDAHGMVFPWYTKPFLDILATWDIKDWDVLEWGGGYSTLWWASHCKSVVTIDSHAEWMASLDETINALQLTNVNLKFRALGQNPHMGNGGEETPYVMGIDEDDKLYDCIIIDGEYRNTCAFRALAHLKPNGVIILDNANQASIGLNSQPTFELFKQYEHHSFLQPGHPDWRTDYWIITPKDNNEN
jgi:hypothetical protein